MIICKGVEKIWVHILDQKPSLITTRYVCEQTTIGQ
jgi:hypothetical protein